MNLYKAQFHYFSRVPWIFKVHRTRELLIIAPSRDRAKALLRPRIAKFKPFGIQLICLRQVKSKERIPGALR